MNVDTEESEDSRGYFDSMKQASGAMDVPYRLLKRMKRDGCPAFRGSRVYREPLEAWLPRYNLDAISVGDGLSATESVQIEVLKERLRKLKLDNDAKEGLFLPREELGRALVKLATAQRLRLIQRLENELPESLTGLTALEIRHRLKDVVDDVCRMFHDRAALLLDGTDVSDLRVAVERELASICARIGKGSGG